MAKERLELMVEAGEKKMLKENLSREIIKIVMKLAITIGLTFLAVKYDFFIRSAENMEYVVGLLLTFCIIYFLCSIMQFAFQTCRNILAALITGVITVAIFMVILSLLPEAIQGYVFIAAVILAILSDLVRLIGHTRLYVKR
ncbi:MAG: hypothetical protein PHY47_17040 [Lachnospiraceae bacterium]|nr:hypothetical protein [Lachnospiraceae bacterium]